MVMFDIDSEKINHELKKSTSSLKSVMKVIIFYQSQNIITKATRLTLFPPSLAQR